MGLVPNPGFMRVNTMSPEFFQMLAYTRSGVGVVELAF
jgi:hypothetical protein